MANYSKPATVKLLTSRAVVATSAAVPAAKAAGSKKPMRSRRTPAVQKPVKDTDDDSESSSSAESAHSESGVRARRNINRTARPAPTAWNLSDVNSASGSEDEYQPKAGKSKAQPVLLSELMPDEESIPPAQNEISIRAPSSAGPSARSRLRYLLSLCADSGYRKAIRACANAFVSVLFLHCLCAENC